jgi:hypothetical protein
VSNGSSSSVTISNGQHAILDPAISMRHIELLTHLITVTGPSLAEARRFDPRYGRIVMYAAISNPCLMHEILALIALPLSWQRPGHARTYREEAMIIQTQALTLFNMAKADITVDNCSAVLMFASFLSLHALADAVAALEASADGFLDRSVSYLNLHRGVRVIINQAWSLLRSFNVGVMLNRAESSLLAASTQLEESATPMTEHLRKLLDFDNMSTTCKTACNDAVTFLLHLYQFEPLPGEQHTQEQTTDAEAFVWTWPVSLSGTFTDLLMQRSPGALIILCHYAVLLHHRRHMWFVGNAGRALIEAVTSFLGTNWRDWLIWPNAMLDSSPWRQSK